MRMTLNLFRKTLQRHGESPWEVVGRYDIAPVSMYDDDEDIKIAHVDVSDLFAVADFDIASTSDIRKGVVLARREVLRDAARKGFNALVEEGWQLTLLRRDHRHRVIVQYTGRPGRLYGDVPAHPPPFIDLLRQVSIT